MICRIQTLKVTREETVNIGQEVSSLLVALFVKNAEYSPVNQTRRLAALYCTEGAESFLACDAWLLCWGFIVLSTRKGRNDYFLGSFLRLWFMVAVGDESSKGSELQLEVATGGLTRKPSICLCKTHTGVLPTFLLLRKTHNRLAAPRHPSTPPRKPRRNRVHSPPMDVNHHDRERSNKAKVTTFAKTDKLTVCLYDSLPVEVRHVLQGAGMLN